MSVDMERRKSEFVEYWKAFVSWEHASRSHNLGLDNKSQNGGAAGAVSNIVMSLEAVADFFETTTWNSPMPVAEAIQDTSRIRRV